MLFLQCFLACLFAFVVVLVLATQVLGFLAKRWVVKHLPEILHAAHAGGMPASGDAGDQAGTESALRELIENAAKTPPGIRPHLSVVTCRCGSQQSVPLEHNLHPFLAMHNWVYLPINDGWSCPTCVGRLLTRG